MYNFNRSAKGSFSTISPSSSELIQDSRTKDILATKWPTIHPPLSFRVIEASQSDFSSPRSNHHSVSEEGRRFLELFREIMKACRGAQACLPWSSRTQRARNVSSKSSRKHAKMWPPPRHVANGNGRANGGIPGNPALRYREGNAASEVSLRNAPFFLGPPRKNVRGMADYRISPPPRICSRFPY